MSSCLREPRRTTLGLEACIYVEESGPGVLIELILTKKTAILKTRLRTSTESYLINDY